MKCKFLETSRKMNFLYGTIINNNVCARSLQLFIRHGFRKTGDSIGRYEPFSHAQQTSCGHLE
jgi:hypothetical protein